MLYTDNYKYPEIYLGLLVSTFPFRRPTVYQNYMSNVKRREGGGVLVKVLRYLQVSLVIITIIIIIIAFTGAFRDFLQSLHCTRKRLQHVRSSGPGMIVCKSRATHRVLVMCNISCYVPRGTKGQLTYQVKQSLNLMFLSFILWDEPLTD